MNDSQAAGRFSLRMVPPLVSGATPRGPTRLQVRPSSPDQPKLLTITHRDEGSVWVVELTGEADLSTQSTVEQALNLALTQQRSAVVVDVSGLTFCDSTCVSAVLDANRVGCLVLEGDSGIVSRVFDLLDPEQQLARRA